MNDNELPDDGMSVMVVGHLLIRDVTTGEVLINRRDAVVDPIDRGSD